MLSRMRRIDCGRARGQIRIGECVCDVLLDRQSRISQIENVRNVGSTAPAPNSASHTACKMRLDQVAVGEVERRGRTMPLTISSRLPK